MAFDFKKIKDSIREISKKSIEGVKNIFKGTIDMKKQKKNKKSLLAIMGFEKINPVKKKDNTKKVVDKPKSKASPKASFKTKPKASTKATPKLTPKENDNNKTVRTVKLRKSHRRVVIGRLLWISFLVALVFLGLFSYK